VKPWDRVERGAAGVARGRVCGARAAGTGVAGLVLPASRPVGRIRGGSAADSEAAMDAVAESVMADATRSDMFEEVTPSGRVPSPVKAERSGTASA